MSFIESCLSTRSISSSLRRKEIFVGIFYLSVTQHFFKWAFLHPFFLGNGKHFDAYLSLLSFRNKFAMYFLVSLFKYFLQVLCLSDCPFLV